jgi:hypothetical protein
VEEFLKALVEKMGRLPWKIGKSTLKTRWNIMISPWNQVILTDCHFEKWFSETLNIGMNTCWFYNEVHLFRFSSRCFVQLSMSKCWSWDGKCEGTTYWIFSGCLLRKHPKLGFIWLDIPSGKLTVCELENDHRNSWFNH